MPRLLRLALAAVLATLLLPSAANADKPTNRTLYADGPAGRMLMGGEWLFRLDKEDVGLKQRFQRQTSREGWSPVEVPHVWNVGDDSPESMAGSTGWYRKDFELPSAASALSWAVRFESVNYRSQVWLNGKPVGTNKGAYIPFEFVLSNLKRRGTNRLVVRVDSRRRPTDFPPSGLTTTGAPTGGWWNYGGLQREVYLRKIDRLDWRSVRVTPDLPCRTCAATVKVEASFRNLSRSGVRARVTGRLGRQKINLGTVALGPGAVTKRTTTVRVAKPKLWSPDSPNLYTVRLSADGGGRRLAAYRLKTGIRSIKVSNGRLMLNGQKVNIRGLGLHEDSKEDGFAVDNALREKLVDESKALGATMIRTHYPLHPYTHELADRKGLLIWSEIPVYAVKTRYLTQRTVRALAAKELAKNIETFANHPSVMLWSIGNELSSQPGPVQGFYIKRAVSQAKRLDPSRPVGIAVAGYPSSGCQPEYGPLDVIGVNTYFGWYPGPSGQLFDRRGLGPYLDKTRECYPNKALMVTEFGAEANREGPVEEKGTYAYQRDYVNYNLTTFASKPYLSGALYWALNEFRVRPGWDGGNPRPNSPIHQKGLTFYGNFNRKPAWFDTQKSFQATDQLGSGPAAPAPTAP
ncbi:MAG: GH2 [uncultured Solirubrobacteraceae bacterium]|uniref:GH2 n=1 Tax=uncultured Solirubrobacteraceae bacterium TaxID=1162706 RepID=A0A6J4U3L4_9ACTN|nr:MAG: GH2 [uncultured Solirubrobacteraceae bacterium]